MGRFHFSDCDLSVNALTREFFKRGSGLMLTFCPERKTKNFGKTLQAFNHINQGLRFV